MKRAKCDPKLCDAEQLFDGHPRQPLGWQELGSLVWTAHLCFLRGPLDGSVSSYLPLSSQYSPSRRLPLSPTTRWSVLWLSILLTGPQGSCSDFMGRGSSTEDALHHGKPTWWSSRGIGKPRRVAFASTVQVLRDRIGGPDLARVFSIHRFCFFSIQTDTLGCPPSQ